jgi:hypothetical protein
VQLFQAYFWLQSITREKKENNINSVDCLRRDRQVFSALVSVLYGSICEFRNMLIENVKKV